MKKRLLSVILGRKSQYSGPFYCPTERWPWLQLIDAIDLLDGSFLGRAKMWIDDSGSEVESYKHVEFVFPRGDRSLVFVLAKSEYGEYILRRALVWVDIYEVRVCA